MKKVNVAAIIKGTFKRLGDPYFAGSAAEVAFWLILSLMPATILLVQILQVFTLSTEAAQNIFGVYISGETYNIIAPLLDFSSRKSVTVLLVAIALVAGSNAVYALMRIINLAYGNLTKASSTIARTIIDRLNAVLMTLLVLVTMIFALYILVYGELFVKSTLAYTNDILGNDYTFSEIWYGMRWIIAFLLFFITVFSLYYLLPRSGLSYKDHFASSKLATARNIFTVWLKGRRLETMRAMPGSIFAAVTMLIVTRIYTLIVRNVDFDNVNILYGGFSSAVVLLLWFYAIGYVLIAGIQVNATHTEYLHEHEAQETGKTGETDNNGD